jgi:hypothetical protein
MINSGGVGVSSVCYGYVDVFSCWVYFNAELVVFLIR